MNTGHITTWIARHKGRTALIAALIVLMCWDWFALPQLLIAITLPLIVLTLPLLLLAAPVVLAIWFLRRRRAANTAPAAGPARPVTPAYGATALARQDAYDLYPERFESVDLGDDVER